MLHRSSVIFFGCVGLLAAVTSVTSAATTQPATTRAAEDDGDRGSTIIVHKGSLSLRIDGDGVFEPVDPVEIKFKPKTYAGDMTITYCVAGGTAVKAGDKLLTLDEKPITKDLATAANEVENTSAALVKAKSDGDLVAQADANAMKTQIDDLQNATDAVKWFDAVDGPQMLQGADLAARQAQYTVDDANDELDQLKKMYKTEDLTTATADIVIKRALRQLDLNKIAAANAKDEARKIKESSEPEARRRLTQAVDQQTNALEQLKATQAQSAITRKTAISTAQIAFDEAAQKLADLQGDQKQFVLTAPHDGVAYLGQFSARAWINNDAKQYAVGEKLTAGSVAVTLVTPGKMQVAMDLPEAKFTSAKAGLATVVVADATGERYEGKTIAPVPLAKPAGFELIIKLPDVDTTITPGMKATVAIDAGKADGIILVPSAAVSNDTVWISQGDETKPRHVVTGRTGNDKTEILDGVSEGETIFAQAQK